MLKVPWLRARSAVTVTSAAVVRCVPHKGAFCEQGGQQRGQQSVRSQTMVCMGEAAPEGLGGTAGGGQREAEPWPSPASPPWSPWPSRVRKPGAVLGLPRILHTQKEERRGRSEPQGTKGWVQGPWRGSPVCLPFETDVPANVADAGPGHETAALVLITY